MMLPKSLQRTWVGVAILLLTLHASAPAALLVYEGFNGYAAANLSTVKPNGNTIGLDTSATYAGNAPSNYTLNATSLAFSGNFTTTGGRVDFGSTGSYASIPVSLSTTPFTGTLYSSYLVNLSTFGSASSDGTQTRVSNDTTNGTARLMAAADTRSGTSKNIAVTYSGTAVAGTQQLLANTTYLILARWTNVGTTLSAGTPGDASLYALTADQYDSFLAAGATQAYLDTTGIGAGGSLISGRATQTVTSGSFAFASTNHIHMLNAGGIGSFDEFRYGSDLASVVAAIPEPNLLTISLGLAAGAILFRQRRRTS